MTEKQMKQIVKMNITNATLEGLREKYAKVPDVTTKTGYELARLGIAEIRTLRTGLGECKKEKKAEALAFTRKVDGEYNRILDILVGIETPMKDAKNEYDVKKEAEKEERRKEEEQRVFQITEVINELREIPFNYADKSSEEIKNQIETIDATEVKEDIFMEFTEEAETVKKDIMFKLAQLLSKAIEREEEDKRQKEEKERLADERQKFEEEKAEEEKERNRVAAIRERIDLIKGLPFNYQDNDSSGISLGIASLEAIVLSENEFDEFLEEAMDVKEEVLSKLQSLKGVAEGKEDLEKREAIQKAKEDEERLTEERKEEEKERKKQEKADKKLQKEKRNATIKALDEVINDMPSSDRGKGILDAIIAGDIPDVRYDNE